MRARGAQVTDIVVLVVAADDSVMPQTIEAISHAKNAGVPLIVAINKIDLPQANPSKVKQELLQHGVVLEEFGGTTLSHRDLGEEGHERRRAARSDPAPGRDPRPQGESRPTRATARSSKRSSIRARARSRRCSCRTARCKVGDDFICGMYSGRVRALLDERGKPVKSAGPAIPVQMLGIEGVPMAGDQFLVVEDATAAREVAQRRERLDREAKSRRTHARRRHARRLHGAGGGGRAAHAQHPHQGRPGRSGGSARRRARAAVDTAKSRSRSSTAASARSPRATSCSRKAAGAIIIGFHVRPDNNARTAAEREGVDIKLYRIIYEAVADVRAALEGMLRPEEREVMLGEAEVREVFKISRIGTIAGCSVRSGVINRQGRVRVIRDGVEVFDGTHRVAPALQGRRARSARRLRVRYRHRELQRPQGRRRHRVLPHRGGRAHARVDRRLIAGVGSRTWSSACARSSCTSRALTRSRTSGRCSRVSRIGCITSSMSPSPRRAATTRGSPPS